MYTGNAVKAYSKARSLPKDQNKREVEKELTGRESEPWFKLYKTQIPVVEQGEGNRQEAGIREHERHSRSARICPLVALKPARITSSSVMSLVSSRQVRPIFSIYANELDSQSERRCIRLLPRRGAHADVTHNFASKRCRV